VSVHLSQLDRLQGRGVSYLLRVARNATRQPGPTFRPQRYPLHKMPRRTPELAVGESACQVIPVALTCEKRARTFARGRALRNANEPS
jgi:hypothetical protein